MQIGLLWYDRDPKRPLVQKIEAAAERYLEKYGVAPDTCHVNPRELVGDAPLRLVGNPLIQPNYLWIGVEEAVELPRPLDPDALPPPATPARRRRSSPNAAPDEAVLVQAATGERASPRAATRQKGTGGAMGSNANTDTPHGAQSRLARGARRGAIDTSEPARRGPARSAGAATGASTRGGQPNPRPVTSVPGKSGPPRATRGAQSPATAVSSSRAAASAGQTASGAKRAAVCAGTAGADSGRQGASGRGAGKSASRSSRSTAATAGGAAHTSAARRTSADPGANAPARRSA